MSTVEHLVRTYELLPHPEGGFYKETYRSEYSTAIYYLLPNGHHSALHRIKSDEMWHFYGGDPIVIVELDNGVVKETLLNAQNVQHLVPANTWFGAYIPNDSKYAFTGCTVAPAFQFKDFELASKQVFLKEFPQFPERLHFMLKD